MDYSADPNTKRSVGGGTTALMLAAGKGDLNIARLLLDHGAKIDAKDENKETVLDYAKGNAEMTKLLTEYADRPENQKKNTLFKRVWNKVAKKSDSKKGDLNKRLSADSEATLNENDTERRLDIDGSLSTDTLVSE